MRRFKFRCSLFLNFFILFSDLWFVFLFSVSFLYFWLLYSSFFLFLCENWCWFWNWCGASASTSPSNEVKCWQESSPRRFHVFFAPPPPPLCHVCCIIFVAGSFVIICCPLGASSNCNCPLELHMGFFLSFLPRNLIKCSRSEGWRREDT